MKNFIILNRFKKLLLIVGCTFVLGACSSPISGNSIINRQQRIVDKQAALQVGFPAIHNFAEKQEYKLIYELRDHFFPTITYVKGMHGHLHKMCDSVGYGIPYSTQYSNPDRRVIRDNMHNYTIPQADPNGLYSSSSTHATWVLCYDQTSKRIEPVYSEPNIIVSQFPLDNITSKSETLYLKLSSQQLSKAVHTMNVPRG